MQKKSLHLIKKGFILRLSTTKGTTNNDKMQL